MQNCPLYQPVNSKAKLMFKGKKFRIIGKKIRFNTGWYTRWRRCVFLEKTHAKNVFVRRMDKWSVRMPNAAWTKMLKCWKDVCRFLETMYVVRSTGCAPFLHKRQDLFDLRLWPLVLVVLRYVVLPESIQDVIFRITSVHLPSILKKLTNLDLEWVLCNVCTYELQKFFDSFHSLLFIGLLSLCYTMLTKFLKLSQF